MSFRMFSSYRDVPSFKVNNWQQYNYIELKFYCVNTSYTQWTIAIPVGIYRKYLKNGLTDSIQIWYVYVSGPKSVPILKSP